MWEKCFQFDSTKQRKFSSSSRTSIDCMQYFILCLWCHSECISSPGKLKNLPDHGGTRLANQRSRVRFVGDLAKWVRLRVRVRLRLGPNPLGRCPLGKISIGSDWTFIILYWTENSWKYFYSLSYGLRTQVATDYSYPSKNVANYIGYFATTKFFHASLYTRIDIHIYNYELLRMKRMR